MDVNNENIFLTGHTLSGTDNWDTYTIAVDTDGTMLWQNTMGNPRGFKPKYIHDEAWGVRSTADGGCIVVAGTGDEYGIYSRKCGDDVKSGRWAVYLIKYGANGSLEWQQTYHSSDGNDWAGEDVVVLADGSLMVAVDNGSFGFLKID